MGPATLLACVALLALAGCSDDKRREAPPVERSLRAAATVHLRALARIGERNRDTRAAGTAGYDASVDYVAGRLRAAGYRVRFQDVAFPARLRREAGVREHDLGELRQRLVAAESELEDLRAIRDAFARC